MPHTDESVRFFNAITPQNLPANTHMFDVMALDRPGDTRWVKVGELYNKTEFTKSLYGDERLFFNHEAAGKDLTWWEEHDRNFDRRAVRDHIRPELLPAAPAWSDPDMPFQEWKDWYDVPLASDDVV